MRNTFLYGLLLAICTISAARAQDGSPPNIELIRWEVTRGFDTFVVYDRDIPIGTRADVESFLHQELDEVLAVLEVTDPDWEVGDPNNPSENEPVYLRFEDRPVAEFGPPQPPPIPFLPDGFFPEEGFRPPPGEIVLLIGFEFAFPEFAGRNQRRLRGEIDFDCLYELEFAVSNEAEPDPAFCGAPLVRCEIVQTKVIENSELPVANPPAFADAGSDRSVAVNSLVTLDASRTYDAYNVGFSVNNPNVFEKDNIVFTWEWISGPIRVDPVQTSQNNPKATVQLDTLGTYVYRVTVDDNINGLPSTDTVTITVVQSLPQNRGPTAVIVGPGAPVVVGTIVTLDGRQSSDPEGDTLTFRWTQTDELGGPLPFEGTQEAFQPLAGVESSVSAWQTVKPGTYHFRLVVGDGEFLANTTFSVEVVAAATGGVTVLNPAASGNEPEADPQVMSTGACGAGLLPLALMPLLLGLMRKRVR